MLGTSVERTFTQCCLNIVASSVPNVESDIATVFTQCCQSAVSCCSPTLGVTLPQHSHNIALTLSECWPTSTNLVTTLGFGSKYNVGTMFTLCCLDIHRTLLEPLKISTLERCHKVGAFAGGNFIEVFQGILLTFDQFSSILRGIFHQKVLGAHLLRQEHLFSTIRYSKAHMGTRRARNFSCYFQILLYTINTNCNK